MPSLINRTKRLYRGLLDVPVIGPLVARLVRGTKGLLGLEQVQTIDKMEYVTTAVGGLRTRVDDYDRQLDELRNEVEMQRLMIDQLAAIIEQRHDLDGNFAPAAGSTAKAG